MNTLKNILFVLTLFVFTETSLYAQSPYFIDFQEILNQSDAGKKAQNELKKRLNQTVEKLNKTQKSLQDEEKKIIQQKKLISADEYKTKVDDLRKKVSDLQKNRSQALQKIATQRAKAKQNLLKNLNPIIKDYMKEKQIRMVINRKNIILADEKLDITNDIMKLVNAKIKSVKLD
jgi:Skp family chaperone for outer membrane proteins